MHLVTNNSAGFSWNRRRTCVRHCTLSLSQAIYWQADSERLTIATFATIGCRFRHEETRDWTHTQRDKLWRWSPHMTSACTSPCNFSALRYLLRLLSSPLILSWLNNHSTQTVYRFTNDFLDQLRQCHQLPATLSQMNFAPTTSANSRLISCLEENSCDDHCHSNLPH